MQLKHSSFPFHYPFLNMFKKQFKKCCQTIATQQRFLSFCQHSTYRQSQLSLHSPKIHVMHTARNLDPEVKSEKEKSIKQNILISCDKLISKSLRFPFEEMLKTSFPAYWSHFLTFICRPLVFLQAWYQVGIQFYLPPHGMLVFPTVSIKQSIISPTVYLVSLYYVKILYI